MIQVGSDFSGVGAFDQALKKLGIEYKTIFSCDQDKDARQTYIDNYGHPDYYPDDVYKREIPADPLDLYMTSPPCQAFSTASSNRKGESDKRGRGVLFYNSHEFIKKNNPRFFIFENVRGLMSDDNGKTFQRWLAFLGGKSVNGNPTLFPMDEAANYHLYFKTINSKDHGIPQNRERVFIVGIRDDQDNSFRFPAKEFLRITAKDIISDHVDNKYFLNDAHVSFLKEKSEYINNDFWIGDFRQDEGLRIRKDKISPCLNAHLKDVDFSEKRGQQHILIGINKNMRRLTAKECFRLMGFHESFHWTCSENSAYKQAGNSIVVNVLSKIINNLNL